MNSEEKGEPVALYIYDLSKGLAAQLSEAFLGKKIDGVWHTSIVVFGKEYLFGGDGIKSCFPGALVQLGRPHKIENLGETFVPFSVFEDYLFGLAESSFAGETYNLWNHNCNNFSDDISHFLCGHGIPSHILELSESVLSTPFGQSLRPLLDQLGVGPQLETIHRPAERPASPDLQRLNQQIEEARIKSEQLEKRRNSINEKLARRERKKEKKRLKQLRENGLLVPETENNNEYSNMTDTVVVPENGAEEEQSPAQEERQDTLPSESALEFEAQERKEEEERKKQRDPPIIYKDAVNINTEFDALVGLIDGKLNEEEQQSLEELHQYMLEDEGSWALSENFLTFIGRLLHDKSLSSDVRVRTMNVLALAALKDDVILLLHQDRREHVLMNYAHDMDRLPSEEQEALALFICNLFENLSSSEWLLYISEWTFCNQQTSNIRATTKVAVHALLSDKPVLQERGSAIVHNLATKEVFDDVAVELTMALLQYFQSKPNEEQLFRCMKALAKFTQISGQEVPQLIQMIGPDPKSFKGVSQRIDELIDQISRKVR